MASKYVTKPKVLETAVDLGFDFTTEATNVENLDHVAWIVETANVTDNAGTFSAQVRMTDPNTHETSAWVDLSFSPAPTLADADATFHEQLYDVVATEARLKFTASPAPVAASLVVQDLTYTAVDLGESGNAITIEYTDTGTAGAETVSVTLTAIVVHIQSSTSTATQVKAAIDASAPALALVTVAVTGTGSTAQVTAASTPLASGYQADGTAQVTVQGRRGGS